MAPSAEPDGAVEDKHRRNRHTAHLREALYGTLVLLPVLSYLADESADAPDALWTVGGTAVVLYLAELYASQMARRIVATPEAQGPGLRTLASETWPVAAIALPSMLFLSVATSGGMSAATALTVDIWLSVAVLALCTYLAATTAHTGTLRRLVSTSLSLTAGLVIVLLKVVLKSPLH